MKINNKATLLLSILASSQICLRAMTQIIPDNTLDTESSTVNSIDEFRSRIEGGAIRGDNLFHSFEEFSIREGLEVYFANPEQISNIFSRITGNDVSEIFGTLGVEGTANLFLINPNGIVFGENAAINVNGSFIATTAESVEFEDGAVWNIRDRNFKPILTWNAPIGLGLEATSGKIVVRGNGHNLSFTPERLLVPNGSLSLENTEISANSEIVLLGNGIEFDGGILKASAEKLEIGSVRQGRVKFPSFLEERSSREDDLSSSSIDYSGVKSFADINLDSFSFLNLDANQVTEANLEGKSINLKNGSLISFQDLSSETFFKPQTINLSAKEELLLRGVTTSTPPTIEGLSRGITSIGSQNINITTKNLVLESGGQIGSLAFPSLSSGGINIDASNSVRVSGFIPDNLVLGFSAIGSSSISIANSNPIVINTQNLIVTDGSAIGSTTIDGISGDVLIQAKSVSVEGFASNNTTTLPSQITSVAFGSGTGGNIEITTANLSVLDAGIVATASFSDATAGNINIYAFDSIIVDGFAEQNILDNTNAFSTINSLVSRFDPNLIEVNPLLPSIPLPTGDAGSIFLTTKSLVINNRAAVTVQNDGTGDAGKIEIDADEINLQNEGRINASALSGEGGEIFIESDLLFLEDSEITAFAEGEGDGGNISISTNGSIGIDSNITATGIQGDGGNITINASGLLGLENESLKIDASSKFGQDGTIDIINPQINNRDPIFEFAIQEIDTDNNNIESRCGEGSFDRTTLTYTGRTSFNPSVFDLSSEETYLPAPGFVPFEENDEGDYIWKEGDPIIDSNAVRVDKNGNIYIVAELSPKTARELFCIEPVESAKDG